ncbi:marine proteobacterial sortase target protein [Limibacillus halophilus]|uniref:Ca-activated chloride channel family protein n=1 Tax=Limibacillus halophilus TaxID=1579333 RepID=A0A839SXP9_9PROT|nr:marine proteobacterial sortase target protein [Limibacillus halophilus]MBB3066859.1 Ca-activated chloride channel family protein [Limibacillus halophilus]
MFEPNSNLTYRQVIPQRQQAFLKQMSTTLILVLLWMAIMTALMILTGPNTLRAHASEAPPAGLFFQGGESGKAYAAPLLKSDVVIDLEGPVARVTLRQRFRNPSKRWLEGVYVFPLPEGSAVDRLTLLVGERRIEGEILPKAEARKVYNEAASQGRKASLLESERPNVFATAVANIAPGEEIAVEIGYQDRADFREGQYSYRFPMVVAPRYTPASQPTANLVGSGLPQSQGDLFGPVSRNSDTPGNRLSLVVRLNAGLPLDQIQSLNHPVRIDDMGLGKRVITLSEKSVAPNSDFVLTWRPVPSALPNASLFGEQRDGDSYLMVDLLPPGLPDRKKLDLPRDLILVVDTSGSMSGPSIRQAKAALKASLDRLTPQDRFNVLRFSHDFSQLYASAQPATPSNLTYARKAVDSLTADGGTEMRPALEAALAERPATGRLRQVVFVTDGAVGNEYELFQVIARRLGGNRLFTVGIGSAPNGFFMRKAAEVGRGSFTWIGKVEEVEAKVAGLLSQLSNPAMTNLSLALPNHLRKDAEVYPKVLPDLYAGEPLRFTVKLPGARLADLRGSLLLSGGLGGEAWSAVLPMEVVNPGRGLAALWARDKIEEIEDQAYQPGFSGDQEALRSAATEVALAHELVTRYTSLVAVDDSEIARPKDDGLVSGDVERPLPKGWEADKVFGPDSGLDSDPTGAPDDGLLRKSFLPSQEAERLQLVEVVLPQASQTAGKTLGLPQTASPALQKFLAGVLLLGVGLTLLLLALRMPRPRRRLVPDVG